MNRLSLTAITAALALACAASLGACTQAPSPGPAPGAQARLQALPVADVERLWAGSAPLTPVGPATVQRIPVTGGVAVACSQTYSARLGTGRPGGVVVSCGGSCKLKPGATFDQCKTSGCLSSGRTCTPLVCSGGCELSRSCSASKPVGFAIL